MTVHLLIAADARPLVRGDCLNGPRPCPWASCAHSLLVDVSRNGLVTEVGEVDEMPETCALDVADRGNVTLDDIGEIYGLSRERIRQVEAIAFAKSKKTLSRELLDGWTNPVTAVPAADDGEFLGRGFGAAVTKAYERIVPERERGTHLLRGKGPRT